MMDQRNHLHPLKDMNRLLHPFPKIFPKRNLLQEQHHLSLQPSNLQVRLLVHLMILMSILIITKSLQTAEDLEIKEEI
jgi:hypothetical protein